MKSIMKTIMRNTKLVMILAFLPALFSAEQAQAVDYKSTYKGVRYEQPRQHVEYKVATTATAPMAGFQSTSAYSGQFSTGEQFTLNSDGTVNSAAYGIGSRHPGSIRRAGSNINNPDDPDDSDDPDDEKDDGNTPLGDAVLPLLMMSLAFCGYLYLRRKRSEA